MWSADGGVVPALVAALRDTRGWVYLLLFAGALLETVLPFALLIPGEAVFLAGAALAGVGVLPLVPVMLALLGGGLLGDQLSYWLGRRVGRRVLERLAGWPLLSRVLARRRRALAWLRLRGGRAVFLARFGGPVSWFMPTLAGAGRLDYATFTAWNTPAVLLGIGQFIALGYFGGRGVRLFAGDARWALWLVPVALGLLAALVWGWRVRRGRAAACRTPLGLP